MKKWIADYVHAQKVALDSIPADGVAELTDLLATALKEDRQIFAFGNGGSAANCSHFATDVGKGASDKVGRRFRVLSLNDNVSSTGVAAYNLFFMFGLKSVPAGRAVLIVALNPAITLLGAALFFGEPLVRRKLAGIALALAGAAIVIGHGNPFALLEGALGAGEALIFGCVVSWSAFTLIAKHLMAGLSPLAVTTYASLTGTLMLAVATLVEGAPLLPPGLRVGVVRARPPRRARHRGGVRLVQRRRAPAGRGACPGVHQPRAGRRGRARLGDARRARRGRARTRCRAGRWPPAASRRYAGRGRGSRPSSAGP